ncbi:hypothetical protein [Rhizobium sp. M1]|uniref:hypothetical protein n=1 Tax=Rhizobium sp. M1 TaxID=2035453 RepID=UPI000BE8BA8F|nr:hypothetical protein [Rhizobium sp. M1]PDT13400.1 hypothetical protein CO655_01475 [Rhizobium sp. M1]
MAKILETATVIVSVAAAGIALWQTFLLRDQIVAADRAKAIEAAISAGDAYCSKIAETPLPPKMQTYRAKDGQLVIRPILSEVAALPEDQQQAFNEQAEKLSKTAMLNWLTLVFYVTGDKRQAAIDQSNAINSYQTQARNLYLLPSSNTWRNDLIVLGDRCTKDNIEQMVKFRSS